MSGLRVKADVLDQPLELRLLARTGERQDKLAKDRR
jgi:hypothetical protein